MKHFLKETDFSRDDLPALLELAFDLKAKRMDHPARPLAGQSWGMLFFKQSTRTRVSFEVGIHELGGHPLGLTAGNMQLNRGESIEDTARVLSRYLHGLIIRCHEHEVIERFAQASDIPVINALTDLLHPCQIYSDLFTLCERWGGKQASLDALQGRKLAFVGDTACNMAYSWILGGALFGLEISLAGPAELAPDAELCRELAGDLELNYSYHEDAKEAVRGADVVYTDVWVSMGKEAEEIDRIPMLRPYSVTAELMAEAAEGACFMHCLPAHPGLEVTTDVLHGPQSIVLDEAENRLHMQKAILSRIAG